MHCKPVARRRGFEWQKFQQSKDKNDEQQSPVGERRSAFPGHGLGGMRWGRQQCGFGSCAHGRRCLYGLVVARKAVAAALLANPSPPPTAPPGVVHELPTSSDVGSFQTSAALELSLTAPGTESVVTVTSDSNVVTVAPVSINGTTPLGTYALTVNRLGLGVGSTFARPTVTLTTGRCFVGRRRAGRLPAFRSAAALIWTVTTASANAASPVALFRCAALAVASARSR